MSAKANRISRFWKEMRRRKVVGVIIIYASTAFILLQLMSILIEPLHLPQWVMTFFIVLLAVGFPLAVIFSWIFNLSSRGITRTKSLQEEKCYSEITVTHKNSIAVLPFHDMSPEKDQEYFCDGISEEIINGLTKIKDLHVVARTSAFAFKGKYYDIREIGEKLCVHSILEGSVRKSENKIRITAQLINNSDGFHIWSESFDRKLEDIFHIQDEISSHIVDKLKISINPDEKALIEKRHTIDTEAYSLYLKGRYHWNKLTQNGLKKSLEFYNQAIEVDKNYALAHLGVADSYCRLAWYSWIHPETAFTKAEEAVNKADEINAGLAESYVSRGLINMCYHHNMEMAEMNFKKAIQLNPGYSEAHFQYSVFASVTGDHKTAIIEGETAHRLDPITPMMIINLGMRHYYAREYDKTIEIFKKVFELQPGFIMVRYYLAYGYIQKKMYDEALDELTQVINIAGRKNAGFLSALAIIQTFRGEINEVESIIDELLDLEKEKYLSSFWLSMLYFVLGRDDEGFQRMEKGYNDHDTLMVFLKADPLFDNIRSDPRYKEMIKKLNLE